MNTTENLQLHTQAPTKTYISPDTLHHMSFDLAKKILSDGFKPTWIIALWRGGCPIGMAVQGFLKHYGCDADHIAVRTSSYDTTGNQRQIRVHGLEYIVKNMKCTDTVLLVDDVFDSGRSIQALIEKMKRKLRNNFPNNTDNVRIAAVYYKPKNNKTQLIPNYYCVETEDWLVFSHEFEDLTPHEIQEFMGFEMPKQGY